MKVTHCLYPLAAPLLLGCGDSTRSSTTELASPTSSKSAPAVVQQHLNSPNAAVFGREWEFVIDTEFVMSGTFDSRGNCIQGSPPDDGRRPVYEVNVEQDIVICTFVVARGHQLKATSSEAHRYSS